MVTETKRDSLHRKVDLFLNQLTNGDGERLKPYLYEIVDTLLKETAELQARKSETSDLRELVIEIREAFKAIDRRFEQMDKRFEQVDKRFEQVDKRIEQIDKRIDQVDKRIDQIDRRIDQIDARFNRIYQFLMWLAGSIAAGIIGIYLKLFF